MDRLRGRLGQDDPGALGRAGGRGLRPAVRGPGRTGGPHIGGEVVHNTGENFTLSRALLESLQIRPRTGIAVCKPYMAKRAWATGTRQWPEVEWSVEPPPLSFEGYLCGEIPPEPEIELMVGDLQRLEVYAGRGFQAPVEVPEPVWEICRRLVTDGFDRYTI